MTMNDVIKASEPVSAQTLEHVLGTGDLAKLTTQQRVDYYAATCRSLGLNPLTRPFRFMSFQGQTVMYATRDCTDQLRKVHGITLHIVDKQIDADLFLVTVRARTKDGREDEDMAAVTLGTLRGESRANALMKAMTKAKRRVTLSICGLGLTDEAELDTIPGAATFDHEAATPVAPIHTARQAINDATPMQPLRSAAAATPRPERRAGPVYDAARGLDEQDGRQWLLNLDVALANAQSQDEVVQIGGHPSVGHATASAPEHVKRRVSELLAQAYARFAEPDADADTGEVHIRNEEKLASGN
jgi:hypothetical protein